MIEMRLQVLYKSCIEHKRMLEKQDKKNNFFNGILILKLKKIKNYLNMHNL